MTTKFEARIIGRLLSRLAQNGINAALEYGIAVCKCNPSVTKAVVSSAPEPLKTMLDASFAAHEHKRKVAHDEMAARQAKVIEASNREKEVFNADFESARRIGQAVVFLAGLTMAERALCKATKKEIEAAIEMRRNCVRSTKLKEVLQCSEVELKRWSEDGRLPVMFRRRMPSSFGKALDVRHWDVLLVEDALLHINQWREDDALAKRTKQSAK